MTNQEADQLLIERSQQGDKQAFDELMIKYQPRILSLVARYMRDPSEVQDVTQDIFIKAFQALPSFRGDSSLYTWLYRIGLNTVKNHLMQQGRRPPDVDIDFDEAEHQAERNSLQEQDTPEHMLLSSEIMVTVLKTLDQLSDDLRTAVMLREIEGMTYEEIAEVMKCPVGTVRSRLFRARELIDSQLRPLLKGD